jgi:hypothetical protein
LHQRASLLFAMTTVVNEAELAVDHLRETERAAALGVI